MVRMSSTGIQMTEKFIGLFTPCTNATCGKLTDNDKLVNATWPKMLTILYNTVRNYEVLRHIQQQLPQTPGKPLLLAISVTGFFYMHFTTHGTNGFTLHLKDIRSNNG